MKQNICLNNAFYTLNNKPDQTIFLSEIKNLYVKGAINNKIIQLLIACEKTEDEICEALAGEYNYELIYFSLINLRKMGIIETVVNLPSNIKNFYLDISSVEKKIVNINLIYFEKQFSDEFIKLISDNEIYKFNISTINIKDFSNEYVKYLDSFTIILTPDYFEPAMTEFNEFALKKSIKWIPVKPVGKTACFGPLFNYEANGCYNCLIERQKGHRNIEYNYIQQNKMETSFRLAKGYTKNSVRTVFNIFFNEFMNYLISPEKSNLKNTVFSVEFNEIKIKKHKVIKIPYCNVCGKKENINLIKPFPDLPFKLKPQIKSDYNASGQRIKHAEQSYNQYKHHISNITGVISSLKKTEYFPDFFGEIYSANYAENFNNFNFEKSRMLTAGVSCGKGKTIIQAKISAIGEAIERFSTKSFGNEKKFSAKYSDIKDISLNPEKILLFSEKQYKYREYWNNAAETAFVPEKFDEQTEINWTPAWSITECKWKLVPSDYVYYDYSEKKKNNFMHADSNGVAGGNCIEEACVQGIFELVERDAVSMWWYNKIQKQEIDLNSIIDSYVHKVADGLKKIGYSLHLLNLTNDLNFPVIAALAINQKDKNEPPKSTGFGAHFNVNIAIERAILELGQSWTLAERMNIDEYFLKFGNKKPSEENYLCPALNLPKKNINDFQDLSTDDFLKDINILVDKFKTIGLETFIIDLTREEIGLSVVRVIVPGLVHFWPRFGSERLYNIPVKMGWLNKPLTEDELNQIPFYF